MAGRAGREYQEARITDTLGNTFVGQVAAFGPAAARLERVLCVKAQPRYAHKPLRDERTRGSIVVVERGRVTFQEKALRVQEVGGVACVFVNTSDEPFVAFADGDAAAATRPPVTIPCCCVGKSDGDWLSKSTNLVNLSFEPPGGWGAEPSPTPAGPGNSARGLSAAGAAPARTATPAAAAAAAAAAVRASSARAKFTYRSDHERDLCFAKGETIELLSEAEPGGGWWTGRIGARTGIFPSNYVERLAAEPAAARAAAVGGGDGSGPAGHVSGGGAEASGATPPRSSTAAAAAAAAAAAGGGGAEGGSDCRCAAHIQEQERGVSGESGIALARGCQGVYVDCIVPMMSHLLWF
eukprot:COSAG01_NODE_1028_length_12028_cov_5.688826_9_plen_353_part_00